MKNKKSLNNVVMNSNYSTMFSLILNPSWIKYIYIESGSHSFGLYRQTCISIKFRATRSWLNLFFISKWQRYCNIINSWIIYFNGDLLILQQFPINLPISSDWRSANAFPHRLFYFQFPSSRQNVIIT